MADNDLSIINSVFRGSYDGFPFTIEQSNTAGGRKTVKHEYPNRDDQSIEDLGLQPRSYTVSIIVSSDTPSAYIADKTALLEVLEKPGGAILVHPLFGTLNNMVAVSWTLRETMDKLGDGALEVLFEVDDGTGIPEPASLSIPAVQNELGKVISTQTSIFGERFKVDKNTFGMVFDAVDKVESAVQAIKDSTSFVSDINDTATAFSNELADLAADVNSLILIPTDLITSFNNVFTGIENLYNTAESTLEAFSNLLGFGGKDRPNPTSATATTTGFTQYEEDIVFTNFETASYDQRVENNDLVNSVINVSALVGAYSASTGVITASTTVDPTDVAAQPVITAEDIDEISEKLEAEFQIIFADETVPYEVRKVLLESRVVVQQFYNEQRVIAAELVEITVNNQPARLISYQYYGDSTNGEEISLENNQPDLSFIDGTINILSE